MTMPIEPNGNYGHYYIKYGGGERSPLYNRPRMVTGYAICPLV